ncbi:orotidine-5'-phosphate decarboxylase [soil metagenome]
MISAAIKKNNSHLIIGLDSDIQKLPEIFLKEPMPVLFFNKAVIEATKDIAAGYKMNMAFYENKFGYENLAKTLQLIPDDLFSICDGKRGDIENTSELYARTYLDELNFDSITFNPYMGSDSIKPFTKRDDKVIFTLLLTSNPGACDIQELILKNTDNRVYNSVLKLCLKWNKNDNIGFVIGANHHKEIEMVTKKYKDFPLLIPGIGAQSHDLKKLLKSIRHKNYLINASRSIIYAAPKNCTLEEFKATVSARAAELSSSINID